MVSSEKNIPTILVVLGATGDLMAKKIVPALFSLHEKKELPDKFKLVGVSRRDWTDEDLKDHVRAILKVKAPHASRASVDSFLKLAIYHKVTFDKLEDHVTLNEKLKEIDGAWGICTNKLFYLSVPPQFYETIFENLHASHLTDGCSPEEGWTRVVVEKPFGKDEKTAKALDAKLAKLFKEIQIYRVDHYLAKETFQNIVAFRFFNNLFEDNWGNDLIEKIHIREFENIGVEDRGAFYDNVGALRDVGQNHLLQMLALTTMDQPVDLSANAVRAARAAILETLEPPREREVGQATFRAQYEGYRSVKGVAPDSETETYFRIRGSLSHPRWQGVPIVMEAGKRLVDPKEKKEITEIEVIFRHPRQCLCAAFTGSHGEKPPGGHYKNSLIFHQDPKEGITIRFWSKKPGFKMELEERIFEFDLRKTERKSQYTEEYEKLLLDCIAGDQTLFVSSKEISAMWRFIDPIIKAWQKSAVPLWRYAPDSPAIVAEAAAVDEAADRNRIMRIEKKEIGVFGLGKMGANVARQLKEKGWRVVASNRSAEPIKEIEKEGFEAAYSIKDLTAKLSAPRIIWTMITAGKGIDEFIFGPSTSLPSIRFGTGRAGVGGLIKHLEKGDIVIDSGNSFYEDSVRRAKLLHKRGIHFMDVGFSGGPKGARYGGSLMIGGEKKTFEYIEPLFADLSVPHGYSYFGAAGAGHFVKMVHNGIEYGMMQALAEGFAVLKKSPFKLDLEKVAEVYNRGSVIESRLVGWLEEAIRLYGEGLKSVSGSVAYTGEGEWTIKTGKKLKIKLPAIEDAFKFRVRSQKTPSYMGRILSALRNRFGGHSIEKRKK